MVTGKKGLVSSGLKGEVQALRSEVARLTGSLSASKVLPIPTPKGSMFAAISNDTARLSWGDFNTRVNPREGNTKQAFKNARYWVQNNAYIKSLVGLKVDFFDYGFRLVPEEKESRKAVNEWIKKNREAINEFRESFWTEFVTLDNAVCYWRDESTVTALLLKPEQCTFDDAMGISTLKYEHGLSLDQIRKLPADLRERFRKPDITLGEFKDEHYIVVKRVPVGHGFGWPTIGGISHALSQCESMEVGEEVLAFAMRLVVRLHKIGHEIKNGPHAGWDTHFAKKKRSDTVLAGFKYKVGLVDAAVNFDQSMEFPWPDTKRFDQAKWESPKERFAWWAGPLGWMLALRGANPYLMTLLRAQALREREKVLPVLERVFNDAFTPPAPVIVKWSNRCFYDSRIAFDLLKFYTTQGGVSIGSGLTESGFDPDAELDQKEAELRLEKETPGIMQPLVDAAHSVVAGVPVKKSAGRPQGTPDPQNQV